MGPRSYSPCDEMMSGKLWQISKSLVNVKIS